MIGIESNNFEDFLWCLFYKLNRDVCLLLNYESNFLKHICCPVIVSVPFFFGHFEPDLNVLYNLLSMFYNVVSM